MFFANGAHQGVEPLTGCSGSDTSTLDFAERDDVGHQNLCATFPLAIVEIVPVIGSDTVPIQLGEITRVGEKPA